MTSNNDNNNGTTPAARKRALKPLDSKSDFETWKDVRNVKRENLAKRGLETDPNNVDPNKSGKPMRECNRPNTAKGRIEPANPESVLASRRSEEYENKGRTARPFSTATFSMRDCVLRAEVRHENGGYEDEDRYWEHEMRMLIKGKEDFTDAMLSKYDVLFEIDPSEKKEEEEEEEEEPIRRRFSPTPFIDPVLAREHERRKTILENLQGRIIVAEGVPGAGKSRFCIEITMQYKYYNVPHHVENEEVPADKLKEWLADQNRSAFAFQMFMLNNRLEAYRRAMERKKEGKAVFIDRSLQGDAAFFKRLYLLGSISIDQKKTYLETLERGSLGLAVPDHCVYMKVRPETAMAHVKQRGTHGESEAYGEEYYSSLMSAYDDCMRFYSGSMIEVSYDKSRDRLFALPVTSSKSSHKELFDLQFAYKILEDVARLNLMDHEGGTENRSRM
jgi:deoxyadenosine/deoxycytidine kinase